LPIKIDESNQDTFKLTGRLTASQWWGNAVSARSYRDQWLFDGLAEYGGMLYTKNRDGDDALKKLIEMARNTLNLTKPATDAGAGTGKLTDIGPLFLGKRLTTRNSQNADLLIPNKGALVLRMLHYLFNDPKSPEDLFNKMLTDFAKKYAGKTAGIEDFKTVAEEHFANTTTGKTTSSDGNGLGLDWFFDQWVNKSKLPSYRLEYSIVSEGGKNILKGTVFQENVDDDNWLIIIPIALKMSGKDFQLPIIVKGAERKFETPLPEYKSIEVKLDPDMWILSEKTTTQKKQ
jgi:aminopeptidase N